MEKIEDGIQRESPQKKSQEELRKKKKILGQKFWEENIREIQERTGDTYERNPE